MARVKMTGAQFKEFYASEWVQGREVYVDDDSYIVNSIETDDYGTHNAKDADRVEIVCGSLCDSNDIHWEGMAFTSLARAWLKKQSTAVLIIEFPKELEDSVRDLLKSNGIKVMS